MMVVLMVVIVMRGGLPDDVHVQRVFPVVLALRRSRRPERPSRGSLQPSKVGDVVNRPQPFKRTAGEVRHWKSFEPTISIQAAQQGRRSE